MGFLRGKPLVKVRNIITYYNMAAVESFSEWLWWLKVSEALNYYDQVKTKLLKYDLVN